jgi:hypothetical protein
VGFFLLDNGMGKSFASSSIYTTKVGEGP